MLLFWDVRFCSYGVSLFGGLGLVVFCSVFGGEVVWWGLDEASGLFVSVGSVFGVFELSGVSFEY